MVHRRHNMCLYLPGSISCGRTKCRHRRHHLRLLRHHAHVGRLFGEFGKGFIPLHHIVVHPGHVQSLLHALDPQVRSETGLSDLVCDLWCVCVVGRPRRNLWKSPGCKTVLGFCWRIGRMLGSFDHRRYLFSPRARIRHGVWCCRSTRF